MRKKLIILGTSGLAREMAMVVESVNEKEQRWEFIGYVGPSTVGKSEHPNNSTIIGGDDWLLSQDFEADLVLGIGHPKMKASVLKPYIEQGNRFDFPNLIDPLARVDTNLVVLGRGNVITAGCIFTCDIVIQNFNLFNLNTTVGHDVRIGSFNVFNPSVNISGGVMIGDRGLVGTGCQILENLNIGDEASLGAGAVVTKNVPAGQTFVGIPARKLERKNVTRANIDSE